MQGAVAGRDPEFRRVLLLGAVGAVAGCCCNPRLRVAQGVVARYCCRQAAGHVARCCRRPGLMQGAVAGRDPELRRVLLLGAVVPDSELRRVLLQGAAAGRALLQGETQELCRVLLQGCAGRRVLLQGVLGAAACRDSELRRVLLQAKLRGALLQP